MQRGFSGHIDIKKTLDNLVQQLERQDPDTAACSRIQFAWKKVVDPQVLNHTCGVFVVPNTNASEVIIYTDSSFWANDLNMQVERFRMYLNVALYDIYKKDDLYKSNDSNDNNIDGTNNTDQELFSFQDQIERVKKLKFIVSNKKYMNSTFYTSTQEQLKKDDEIYNLKPVPIDEIEEEEILSAAQNIQNKKLKELALSAARANLGKQKAMQNYRNCKYSVSK